MIGMVIAGLLACLIGGVWFGQGIGVIEGSGMTGELVWAVFGSVMLIVGVALFVSAARLKKLQADARAKD